MKEMCMLPLCDRLQRATDNSSNLIKMLKRSRKGEDNFTEMTELINNIYVDQLDLIGCLEKAEMDNNKLLSKENKSKELKLVSFMMGRA